MNLWEINILNKVLDRIELNAKRLHDGRIQKEIRESAYWEIVNLTNYLKVDPELLKNKDTSIYGV